LRAIMIDIKNDLYYNEIEFLRLADANDKGITDIESEFKNSKQVIERTEEFIRNNETQFKLLAETIKSYTERMKEENLRDHLFAENYNPTPLWKLIVPLVLLFPVY